MSADLDPLIEPVVAAVRFAPRSRSSTAGWVITIADAKTDLASSGLFVLGDAEMPNSCLDPSRSSRP